MSKWRPLMTVLASSLVTVVLAPAAGAQELKREPIKPMAGVTGSESFREYCTVCHGIGGRGDGPAAKALKTPPADLTQLTARHDGKYPEALVRTTIMGEQALAAHGTREMPMWGPVFRSVDSPQVTELRVHNLVEYLRSIQQK